MRNKQKTKGKGFTLIELVIAMVILSILSMVAFPGYQKTVRKSRRVDGKVELLKVAQALERCYTEYNRYDGLDGLGEPACDNVKNAGSPTIDFTTGDNDHNGDDYYTISSIDGDGNETLTSNSFSLYARPRTKGKQDLDTYCTEISLDSVGRKRAIGADNDQCW